ncbi:hypothetical protein NDU88_005668 [Pleurodeles waltl]|uniref:Uncharacterized protein n=1 Tax=Pleurodeles waltl TaxID=8319 RepID=A0AAV7UMS1_PLEWA|nr:hypothetical protein NDU88_005668 [Pleurodeles waltl]
MTGERNHRAGSPQRPLHNQKPWRNRRPHPAPPCPTPSPADPSALEATDRILQQIASVGRRLEAMDLKITDLTVASSSIRADIAGFRETANALDQRLTTVEDQVAALPDQEAELRSLRAKITNLEDKSPRT